jgi:LysR family transcriptional regulator, hydrogen peroxide-inducible genes activator
MMMELYQIRYFLALSEALNFTHAAERCNVTQPALSRAIQRLEEELGGLLFRRERSQTHLTDLGRLVKPQLEDILHQTDAASRAARAFLKLEHAPLSVGVMCTIGPARFVSFLTEFRKKNPGIRLTLLEAPPQRLSELLLDGKIDVAIMAQPEPFHERLDTMPLYAERFVIGFPVNHPFEARNAVALRETDGQSYLDRINCEYASFIDTLYEKQGVSLNVEYRSEREDWIQILIAAGMGIAILPEYSATVPGVLVRPIVEPEITRQVSLVTIAGRRFSAAVSAFVRGLRAHRWTS